VAKPTEEQLSRLRECKDSEIYHAEFDTILEEKLMELDPEWMKAMQEVYDKSEICRWYA